MASDQPRRAGGEQVESVARPLQSPITRGLDQPLRPRVGVTYRRARAVAPTGRRLRAADRGAVRESVCWVGCVRTATSAPTLPDRRARWSESRTSVGDHAEKDPRRAPRRAADPTGRACASRPAGRVGQPGVRLERNHSGQPPVLATSASASITLPCRVVWTRILDATATTGGGLSPMSDRSCSGRLTVRPTAPRSWMMTVRWAGFRGD
jgi:hypothetical protein